MITLLKPFLFKLAKDIRRIRGGIKNWVFFTFGQKRGGGLGQSKKSISEKTQIFQPIFFIRGGVFPNPKNSYQKKTEVVKKGGGEGVSVF